MRMTFSYFSPKNPSLVSVRQGIGWAGPFVCCGVTVLRQHCDNLGRSVREYTITASWHDLVFAKRLIINLWTSNVHQTGRNFLGQLQAEFSQLILWECTRVMLPLQNKGDSCRRWDASALGIYWQLWKLYEGLENWRAHFFSQWGFCLKVRVKAGSYSGGILWVREINLGGRDR